ncbi:MAG: hypothetical protein ABWX94_01370 [Candidatus Saccharimonadales bacterium]
MANQEVIDYSLLPDFSWQDIQGMQQVHHGADFDMVMLARMHPNEPASQQFQECAESRPLPNTRLYTPQESLPEGQELTTARYIWGVNFPNVMPPREAYMVNPETQGSTIADKASWDVRRLLSRGFVNLDVHGATKSEKDYATLSPDAGYPARALARHLVGDDGIVMEAAYRQTSGCATNTIVYEVAQERQDGQCGAALLHARLRAILDEGILNFLARQDPNLGARYDYQFLGSIDLPTAASIPVIWSEVIKDWQVVPGRLVEGNISTGTAKLIHGNTPVRSLASLNMVEGELPAYAELPRGCSDIPGLVRSRNRTITGGDIFMSVCSSKGSLPDPQGLRWWAEVLGKSTVDHSIPA